MNYIYKVKFDNYGATTISVVASSINDAVIKAVDHAVINGDYYTAANVKTVERGEEIHVP